MLHSDIRITRSQDDRLRLRRRAGRSSACSSRVPLPAGRDTGVKVGAAYG